MIRNRAQILDDAFNLALAQSIPYGWALDLTQFLEFERDYVPWRSVLTELDYIDIMLFGTTTYLDWRVYTNDINTLLNKNLTSFSHNRVT